MELLISTGEVSGDIIGGHLARALYARCPDVSISGTGGFHMRTAGVEILYGTAHLGSAGITEPLATIPGLLRAFKAIFSRVREYTPSAVVLIGHDFFNLVLARLLKSRGILTFSYFPPQVWVWRCLAVPIARSYDRILTSFPEEHQVYHRARGRATYVGHYLRDMIQEVDEPGRHDARKALGIGDDATVVALLPGSRTQEVGSLGPVLLDAAQLMAAANPSIRFVLPVSDRFLQATIERMAGERDLDPPPILTTNSMQAMAASDLTILCSGTATLEATLLGIPMIVLTAVSQVTWRVVNLLVQTGRMHSTTSGLPNLLAGRHIVPELIQYAARPDKLSTLALSILENPERRMQMRRDLRNVAAGLGEPGALDRAAAFILDHLRQG